jgi:hypothetical protein
MKKNKNIILSLIKDDLTNTQLIDGLNNIGLDAGKYYLNISESFFALMDFGNYDQETKLYNDYFDFAEEAVASPLKNPEQLDAIELEVYNKLLLEKEKRKLKQLVTSKKI